MKVRIGLCKSCIRRNLKEGFDAFSTDVHSKLQVTRPDIEWEIEGQSCFRFCPNDRIALSIPRKEDLSRGRSSMSKDLEVESIVNLVLKENY